MMLIIYKSSKIHQIIGKIVTIREKKSTAHCMRLNDPKNWNQQPFYCTC